MDSEPLRLLYQAYYREIYLYLYSLCRNPETAEDLTQETFARFFRTLSQYQHYGKAANYLYVIAGNLCRDYHKRPGDIPMEELPEQPVYQMEVLDLRLDVHRALEQLPPELLEVTILYFFQELKQKEIARILGVGLPLVKYRIRRAKELLEQLIGKEDAT